MKALSNGTGSLEASRGSDHLSMDGVVLQGEQDIFGIPFDSAAIAALEAAGHSWSGGNVERLVVVGELVERLELERFELERFELEWLELERLVLVGQFLDRLVLVGKLVERQLVERLELERLELVERVMARSELGLTSSGRSR